LIIEKIIAENATKLPEDVIDLNNTFVEALEKAENTKDNIFIFGSAGVGKSVFVHQFMKHTTKQAVVVAPTGVAAINICGQTLHSFFGFKFGILSEVYPSTKLRNLVQKIDVFIIDEISMVRIDLFNAINTMLQRCMYNNKPFGGKQIIIMGDLFQIPPVVVPSERKLIAELYPSRWFFDAPHIETFSMIIFKNIYRQLDPVFKSLLNRCRLGQPTADDMKLLNSKLVKTPHKDATIITMTNAAAEIINNKEMDAIVGTPYTFSASKSGKFSDTSFPVPTPMILKKNAKVIIVKNDSANGVYNGMIGRIVDLNSHQVIVDVNGEYKTVKRCKWESYKYEQVGSAITKEVTGVFEQIPVRPAWALTAHRVQGQTLRQICIDKGSNVFENGQLYVALSRATTLDGVEFTKPINAADFMCDRAVKRYLFKIMGERK
jgi:Cdc6-like AAA superfamily ATPase